jgi:uncharacterized protein (TIGR02117 family)
VAVGTLPVNRAWQNASEGIEVFVYADLVHSELLVPRVTEVVDWGSWFATDDFENCTGHEEYVGIGWGDREFFFHTPTWDDAKATVVAGAMFWPSATVMHITVEDKPEEDEYNRRVVLTPEQYENLVAHIQASFILGEDNMPILIPGHNYNDNDTFYEAKGNYSLLYTCNNWTGDALKGAGVRTGWWTPYPWGLLQPREVIDELAEEAEDAPAAAEGKDV